MKTESTGIKSSSTSPSKLLLRDQVRAAYAYKVISTVPSSSQADYKIAVNNLGSNILRSGLSAALATTERRGDTLLLKHIAEAGVPGLNGATKEDVGETIRNLDVDKYILATREILKVATWLKRAAQTNF
jgi:CRISPR/Cas system CMR-associated protein Cmr5 small subunit